LVPSDAPPASISRFRSPPERTGFFFASRQGRIICPLNLPPQSVSIADVAKLMEGVYKSGILGAEG
jgi:hypothetical protein